MENSHDGSSDSVGGRGRRDDRSAPDVAFNVLTKPRLYNANRLVSSSKDMKEEIIL